MLGHEVKNLKNLMLKKLLDTALTNLKSSIEEFHVEDYMTHFRLIYGDESQITRVFQNLIGNALKFSKKDVKPKIHIKASKEGNE